MSLKNWSTTANDNTSAPPNGAPENTTTLANVNNIMRQIMADVRTLAAGDTIASATTCDLGSKDATWLTVSGTTTITSFGTVSADIYKFVLFSGALTLTHNATSLILRTGANRTTAAGDVGLYKSEGSGNWREYFYSAAGSYQPLDALLTALAAQTTAANNVQAYSGADTPTLLSTGTSSGNIPLVGTSSATDALAGLVELATSAEVKTGTDTARAITPATLHAGKMVTGTAIATTSGTTHDFTSIPSWVRRITVCLSGVSTNGTSVLLIQIGTGGTPTTTGYNSYGEGMDGASMTAVAYTTGFGLTDTYAAARAYHGQVVLTHMGSNIWTASGSGAQVGDTVEGATCGGAVTLAGVLDIVRLTTVSGDTFDAGSVNIIYE